MAGLELHDDRLSDASGKEHHRDHHERIRTRRNPWFRW